MKITFHLKRPTRRHWTDSPPSRKREVSSAWLCSGRGLPCHECYHSCGRLLTCHFTLTHDGIHRNGRYFFCGTFRNLSITDKLPGVTRRPVLWSPDFPLPHNRDSDCQVKSIKIFRDLKFYENYLQ
jgi:hypothetical protein